MSKNKNTAPATTAVRRLFTVVAMLVLVVASTIFPDSGLPSFQTTPEAQAQAQSGGANAPATDLGDCNFRKLQYPYEPAKNSYGDQLCWIHFNEFDIHNPKVGDEHQITKKIGGHTLTATFKWTGGKWKFRADPAFNDKNTLYLNRLLGKTYEGLQVLLNGRRASANFNLFSPYPGEEREKIALIYGPNDTFSGRQSPGQFSIEDIEFRDQSGNKVNNYSFVVADANYGSAAAFNSYLSTINLRFPGADAVLKPQKFGARRGSGNFCTRQFDRNVNPVSRATDEKNNVVSWTGNVDFACTHDTRTSPQPGFFLLEAINPDAIQAELIPLPENDRFQGIAIAVKVGRMGGELKPVDTSYEERATNQKTEFDYASSYRTSSGDTVTPGAVNNAVFNEFQYSPNSEWATPLSAPYVWRSQAHGDQSQYAHKRYKSEWTCRVGGQSSGVVEHVITRDSAKPRGFTLKETEDSTELVYDNKDNQPVFCDLRWIPRFHISNLQLAKSVNGNASSFSDIANREYQIKYSCTEKDNFKEAYPEVKLTDTRNVRPGQRSFVNVLPAGFDCVITEEFDDANPIGEDLQVQWNSPQVPGNPYPSKRVTLGNSTNAHVTNTFNVRTGSVAVDTRLVGDPVPDLSYPRNYNYVLTCPETDSRFTNLTKTVTISQSGTTPSGRVVFDNVPVGRECLLDTQSGLTSEEAKKFSLEARTVTIDGGQPVEKKQNGYPVVVPKYNQGEARTQANVVVEDRFGYRYRNLDVVKEISGSASGSEALQGSTFQINYRCESSESGSTDKVEGTLDITNGQNGNRATIEDVPIGSDCYVWETQPTAPNGLQLDKTTVRATDSSGDTVSLTNEDAQNTKIITIGGSSGQNQSVVVRNSYSPQLGTVSLRKTVDASAISRDYPSSFEFNFACGTRTVQRANGETLSVPLQGTVNVAADTSEQLVFSSDDSELQDLVNSQDGVMGVPFGNTCSFTENAGSASEFPGLIATSNVSESTVAVNAPSVESEVTNTFESAGEGLVVTQQIGGEARLAEPVTYRLECTDASGLPISLGSDATFTLDVDNPSHAIEASKLPVSSDCEIEEVDPDDLVRQKENGGEYPINRVSTFAYQEDTGGVPQVGRWRGPTANTAGGSKKFTIGSASNLTISHEYSLVSTPVNARKVVEFDSETENLISAKKRQSKQEREYEVALVCTNPLDKTRLAIERGISANNDAVKLLDVPVGSDCALTEAEVSPSDGISVDQKISINNGTAEERTVAFVATTNGNEAVVTNTFARQLSEVRVLEHQDLPGNIAEEFLGTGSEVAYGNHKFTMVCREEGSEDELVSLTATAGESDGEAIFEGVPTGAECQVTASGLDDRSLELEDTDSGETLKAHIRPNGGQWAFFTSGVSGSEVTDIVGGSHVSPWSTIQTNDEEVYDEDIQFDTVWDYINTEIKLEKLIKGYPGDLELLEEADPAVNINFNYVCRGLGYTKHDLGLPASLGLSDFDDAAGAGDLATKLYESDEVTVPAGAWCTFTEYGVNNIPVELTNSIEQPVISKRASDVEAGEPGFELKTWEFVNNIERRTAPVNVAISHAGFTSGMSADANVWSFVCKDSSNTTRTLNIPVGSALGNPLTTEDTPPSTQYEVELPVGVECSADIADSPALEARTALKATAGDRRPYAQFATWNNDDASENNPTQPLSELDSDAIDEGYKSYSHAFAVPATLGQDGETLTVAADVYHERDAVNFTFTKESEGSIGDGATFTFLGLCGNEDVVFQLSAGESYTFEDVPVQTPCAVKETDNGVEDVASQLKVTEAGDRLVVDSRDAATGLSDTISLVVLPVENVSDNSDAVSPWALTALNQFPDLSVKKHIDGIWISEATSELFGSVLLPHDAEEMTVTYTVANNGAIPFTDFTVSEPALAGKTLRNDQGSYKVPTDGVLSWRNFCGLENSLAPGQEVTCTFTVPIEAELGETYSHEGTVTVTAQAGNLGKVSASDTLGAVRLSRAVDWLLPNTGVQTLVWFLVLGLGIVGFGLWRYLGGRGDEDEEGASLVHAASGASPADNAGGEEKDA